MRSPEGDKAPAPAPPEDRHTVLFTDGTVRRRAEAGEVPPEVPALHELLLAAWFPPPTA